LLRRTCTYKRSVFLGGRGDLVPLTGFDPGPANRTVRTLSAFASTVCLQSLGALSPHAGLAASQDRKHGGGDSTDEWPCQDAATWSARCHARSMPSDGVVRHGTAHEGCDPAALARCNRPAHTLAAMNTPDHFADFAERNVSGAGAERDFVKAIESARVWALLAIAAAINRLADAVSEVGTPPTYRRRT
jgi:hypothetical protein